MDDIKTTKDALDKARDESIISPRFYSTDYAAMDRIDITPVRAEWDAMMQEFRDDPNGEHFQRDDAFRARVADLEPELRAEFYDFLISSATSEFSGCVLYNEIKRRVNNPDIKELMGYMARDESRHAGFINQSLKDFGVNIDLGDLKRTKKYTYFKPKYIFYATYLSEKIGYARYITIFRQALILRANPHLLQGHNRLWIKFFLLAVYATMYVRDHTRPALHKALGFDPTGYDYEVFRITSEITRQTFPLTLDIDHPRFRQGMETLRELGAASELARKQGGVLSSVKRLWLGAKASVVFASVYLIPSKANALPERVRLAPVW
ncbi:MAG: magnesium-protoporphyrin IX monomethyl ester (oxidative) cyclase [Betaproteobacteria bacterium]|nr:magnesium-protoporphyrin IX monomethyl ester (oxidative) cyclase [Betaproteobacteria bacterium]